MSTIKRKRPVLRRKIVVEVPTPPPPSAVPGDRWAFKPEAMEFYGCKNSVTLWRAMRSGAFPTPYVVGHRNAWLLSDLMEWRQKLKRREYTAPTSRKYRKSAAVA